MQILGNLTRFFRRKPDFPALEDDFRSFDAVAPNDNERPIDEQFTPIPGDLTVETVKDPVEATLIPQALLLKRGDVINSKGQIGSLFHKGVLLCHILEDPSRDIKIYGETAIPVGTYQIVMRTDRGRAAKHGARWPWHRREVMELVDVENFEYIQIHPGNYPKDTLGCLLPGERRGGSMMVSNSVAVYKMLYEKFGEHARQGLLYIRIEEPAVTIIEP